MEFDEELQEFLFQSVSFQMMPFVGGLRIPFFSQGVLQVSTSRKLHCLVGWWGSKGKDSDKTVKGLIEKMNKILAARRARESPFSEKYENDRTILHLAVLNRMPDEFIIGIVECMTSLEMDQPDCKGRLPVEYLLDWEEISPRVLSAFIDQGADVIGKKDCSVRKSPLLRLCRRPVDGDKLLQSIIGRTIVSPDYRNRMLEEAIKGGSASTVKLLLEERADPNCEGRCLLFDAAEAYHESIAKVVHLQKFQVDPSLPNALGLTLVHVAAMARPPRIDLLKIALQLGVDPNARDDVHGDTALHMVTRNYAQKTVRWKASKKAMELLLHHPKANPNVKNNNKATPLLYLMAAKRRLSSRLLMMWHYVRADFTGGVATVDHEEALLKSPLAELSRRCQDGHELYDKLLTHRVLVKETPCRSYMLEAAVIDGSAAMVEVLLKNGADANAGNGQLLKYAASSRVEAVKKLKCLRKREANREYKDSQGYSVLHTAAQSATAALDVVQACIRQDCLNIKLDTKDRKGNTALHVAAQNKHQGSDLLVRTLADKEHGGDPNSTNDNGQSPLRLVLKENYSEKALRRDKVLFLLEKGCQPTKNDFKDYQGSAEDFKNLFLSTDVFAKSHYPIQLLLCLGEYCQSRYDTEMKQTRKPGSSTGNSESQTTLAGDVWKGALQWRKLKDNFEAEAIVMIEEFGKDQQVLGGVMTNNDIGEARKLGWDKFLSNRNVGKLLTQMFLGQVDASNAERRDKWQLEKRSIWCYLPLLIVVFLLQSLLFPLSLLKFVLNCCCGTCGKAQCREDKMFGWFYVRPTELPVVTFYSNMIGYLVFLMFLLAHTVQDSPEGNYTWIDWMILLYVVAMLAEEIYQIRTYGRKYLTITNIVDDVMISLFCIYFVIREVAIGSVDNNLTILRVSEHVFAVAAAFACARVLYYMQVNRKLGPIQMAFLSIMTEVLSFMAILGVALLAFGVAISGVYSAGEYTAEFRNGSVSLPQLVRSLWPSIQTMYWSLYGQISYEDLRSEHDALLPETVVGLILFALWSLTSVIVLLNMLIALVDEAFNRVRKENADFVWNLAVSCIVTEIKSYPTLPLPFNFFYLIAILISAIYEAGRGKCEACCSCKQGEAKFEARDRKHLYVISMTKCMTSAYRKAKGKLDRLASGEVAPSAEKHEQDHLQTQLGQLAGELKNLHSQMQRLPSKMKRVNSQIQSPEGRNEVDSGPTADAHDDPDTDLDEEDQCAVRYERVSYDERQHTISYEGKTAAVGGCQFLFTPMSKDFQYFEVTVVDYGKYGRIGVGLARRNYPLHRMPGWKQGSVAFHCDDGKLFHENGRGVEMATPAQEGDVIGCGIQFDSRNKGNNNSQVVFFTRNGEEIGYERVNVPQSGFYPTVGLHSEGEKVEVRLKGKYESPDEAHEILSDLVRQEDTLRMTEDSFDYDELSRRLRCTSRPPRVGIFQDLSRPITSQFNYYEVKLVDMGMKGAIGIGVAGSQYPFDRMPGWDVGSAAYHCDDGIVYKGLPSKSTFSPAERGEVIGCGVKVSAADNRRAKVFFTRDRVLFEDYETEVPIGGFYPTIGMLSAGEEIDINFEAKWPPQKFRSERVGVESNIIKYIGDKFMSVGAYQYLGTPMSRNFSYYEVTVKDCGRKGTIAIGLARRDYPLSMQPGWLEGSVAWHCDDGGLFVEKGHADRHPHDRAKRGDVIGCGIDFKETQAKIRDRQQKGRARDRVVYFTINGVRIDHATLQEPEGGLFPTVGMHSPGEVVEISVSSVLGGTTRLDDCSMGTARKERVQVEGNCVSYNPNDYGDVGGVQLLGKNMHNLRYFEVKVISTGERGTIGIGIAHKGYPLDHQPGWEDRSIAYHCDDGVLYHNGESCKNFSDRSATNDVIGCGVRAKGGNENPRRLTVYFTRNGVEVGEKVFDRCSDSELYPTLCMHSPGEAIQINLNAQTPVRESVFARSERVRIEGNVAHYDPGRHMDVGAVQLNRKLSKKDPYFEVRVLKFGAEGAIGVGLAPIDYPLDCEPGWLPGSVGYHCDDGCLFEGAGFGHPIREPGVEGDIIGCGVEFQKTGRSKDKKVVVYFKHNGNRIPKSESELEWPDEGLFPTVGMHSRGEAIEVVTHSQSAMNHKHSAFAGDEQGELLPMTSM